MIDDSSRKNVPPIGSSAMWIALGSVTCVFFLLCVARCFPGAQKMAQQTQCAANMKAIASACLVYGNTKSLSASTLICPCSKEPFIYVSRRSPLDPRDVIIYEPQGNHQIL